MRWFCSAVALALATLSALPAGACRVHVPINLGDVHYASTVVVGRISNYRIVLDPKAREARARILANSPDMSREVRQMLESQTAFLSDYARFDVIVDDVLFGTAPGVVSVTWQNSTFGEPASMAPGPYLIALRAPGSVAPDPTLPTLLQAPCSSPFLFPVASEEAVAVRRIIAR